jgi:hypothetical protein
MFMDLHYEVASNNGNHQPVRSFNSVQPTDNAGKSSNPERCQYPSEEYVHPKIDSKQTTPPKANTSYQVLGLVRVWKPIALLLEIDYGKQRVQRVNECLEFRVIIRRLDGRSLALHRYTSNSRTSGA